ncbi:putative Transposon Ty3-I Gag-Pol polyprotein [Hypsibius exemplaris]|uniref:RNA-directed DNA polymerase n=1 Tax=Hypsibius exemplaris TaxID=2072580 RepID=A0A9X6NLU6_HYPEX|nr:putative Transposon Ty3-I Gag-Pol polyprotein [Hypsibius exemplaris]
MLTNAPILGHFNPALELVLETDASTFGLGAVLSQMSDGRPEVLAYASRTLKAAERNYSACELELTAVVWAITEKFHSYVGGSKLFKVVTDHNALVGLLKLKNPKGRLARWVELLRPYHMEVLYRPGRENSVPDFLSRYPYDDDDVPTNQVLSGGLTVKSTSNIQQMQEDDVFCRGILRVLRGPTNSPTYRNKILFFIVKGNLLYRMVIRDGRRWFLLVVPQSLQKDLIQSAHDDSGHQGIARTYARLHDKYFWKGCLNQVVDYVSSCEACQMKKNPPVKPGGFLQPIPVAGPFHAVGIDYMGPMVTSKRGNKFLLVATCLLTRWVETRAVKAQTSAAAAAFFVEQIALRHGAPAVLVSDRGTPFIGSLMQQILKLLGTSHTTTTAYNPRANGLTERTNGTIAVALSHYVSSDHRDWDCMVPHVTWYLNTCKQETTKFSPFELVYGRVPVFPIDVALGNEGLEQMADLDEYAEATQEWLAKAREIVQERVNATHDKEAPYFNAKHREVFFSVGDLVLLWSPPKLRERELKGKKQERNQESVVHVKRLKPFILRYDDDAPMPVETDGQGDGNVHFADEPNDVANEPIEPSFFENSDPLLFDMIENSEAREIKLTSELVKSDEDVEEEDEMTLRSAVLRYRPADIFFAANPETQLLFSVDRPSNHHDPLNLVTSREPTTLTTVMFRPPAHLRDQHPFYMSNPTTANTITDTDDQQATDAAPNLRTRLAAVVGKSSANGILANMFPTFYAERPLYSAIHHIAQVMGDDCATLTETAVTMYLLLEGLTSEFLTSLHNQHCACSSTFSPASLSKDGLGLTYRLGTDDRTCQAAIEGMDGVQQCSVLAQRFAVFTGQTAGATYFCTQHHTDALKHLRCPCGVFASSADMAIFEFCAEGHLQHTTHLFCECGIFRPDDHTLATCPKGHSLELRQEDRCLHYVCNLPDKGFHLAEKLARERNLFYNRMWNPPVPRRPYINFTKFSPETGEVLFRIEVNLQRSFAIETFFLTLWEHDPETNFHLPAHKEALELFLEAIPLVTTVMTVCKVIGHGDTRRSCRSLLFKAVLPFIEPLFVRDLQGTTPILLSTVRMEDFDRHFVCDCCTNHAPHQFTDLGTVLSSRTALMNDPDHHFLCQIQIGPGVTCREPVERSSLFHKSTRINVCPIHFDRYIRHQFCVCDEDIFVDLGSRRSTNNPTERCLSHHLYHRSCAVNGGCPHRPCSDLRKISGKKNQLSYLPLSEFSVRQKPRLTTTSRTTAAPYRRQLFKSPRPPTKSVMWALLLLLVGSAAAFTMEACDCRSPAYVGVLNLGHQSRCSLPAQDLVSVRVRYQLYSQHSQRKQFPSHVCRQFIKGEQMVTFLLGGYDTTPIHRTILMSAEECWKLIETKRCGLNNMVKEGTSWVYLESPHPEWKYYSTIKAETLNCFIERVTLETECEDCEVHTVTGPISNSTTFGHAILAQGTYVWSRSKPTYFPDQRPSNRCKYHLVASGNGELRNTSTFQVARLRDPKSQIDFIINFGNVTNLCPNDGIRGTEVIGHSDLYMSYVVRKHQAPRQIPSFQSSQATVAPRTPASNDNGNSWNSTLPRASGLESERYLSLHLQYVTDLLTHQERQISAELNHLACLADNSRLNQLVDLSTTSGVLAGRALDQPHCTSVRSYGESAVLHLCQTVPVTFSSVTTNCGPQPTVTLENGKPHQFRNGTWVFMRPTQSATNHHLRVNVSRMIDRTDAFLHLTAIDRPMDLLAELSNMVRQTDDVTGYDAMSAATTVGKHRANTAETSQAVDVLKYAVAGISSFLALFGLGFLLLKCGVGLFLVNFLCKCCRSTNRRSPTRPPTDYPGSVSNTALPPTVLYTNPVFRPQIEFCPSPPSRPPSSILSSFRRTKSADTRTGPLSTVVEFDAAEEDVHLPPHLCEEPKLVKRKPRRSRRGTHSSSPDRVHELSF